MPITYPLTMPALGGPSKVTWSPISSVVRQQSEFTLQSKVYAWDGQQRSVTVDMSPMDWTLGKAWQAFLYKLNGIEGTFYFRDFVGSAARGTNGPATVATPKVNGAGQTGTALVTDGWAFSKTALFKAGDWLSIGDRLYTVLDDCNSNGSGQSTISVWPFLTGTLADNADILVGTDARGIFRMLAFPTFFYDLDQLMTGFQFGAEEAF